jgi:phage terminase small subunit
MNSRQKRFVALYLVDLNATQAAINAGYSEKTAGSQGERLLKNVEIARLVQQSQNRRMSRLELTADNVIEALRRIVMFDPASLYSPDGHLLPLHEIPPEARACLSGLDVDELYVGEGEERRNIGRTTKVKFWSKTEGIKAAMAHLALLAPTDVRISGEITLQAMSDDDVRARALVLIAKARGEGE